MKSIRFQLQGDIGARRGATFVHIYDFHSRLRFGVMSLIIYHKNRHNYKKNVFLVEASVRLYRTVFGSGSFFVSNLPDNFWS